MTSCEDGGWLPVSWSNDGGSGLPSAVRSQLYWYDNGGEFHEDRLDSGRLFDCWSDDDEPGNPCRPCGFRRPQQYCYDNASDSSLQSCHSADKLRQWTVATLYCPKPRCPAAARPSRRHRSRSTGEDDERRRRSSSLEMLDADDNNQVNRYGDPLNYRAEM